MTNEMVFEKTDEYGMSVRVFTHTKGFVVNLYDIDAEAYVPGAIIFPDQERAIIKAKAIAAGLIPNEFSAPV